MSGKFIRIFLVVSLYWCFTPAAVRPRVDVGLSQVVDTSDAEKKAVFDLWVDYLNARPDVMWSDQNWDGAKSRYWTDFDLTAPFVYQFGADRFLELYRPTVMAIEKEGARYSIRTLFCAEGLDSAYAGRNPWAIVRVYAQRESGSWKLRTALGVLTEDWNRPAIGKITFVSPPSHHFDIRLARRTVAFCDSLAAAFSFFRWGPFDFYITDSREDVDRLIGLEYYIAGFPSGRALRRYDVLITGTGTEWHPQELVHMVATGPDLAPHRVVNDGFAGWVAGWTDKSYADNMREVARFVAANDTLSFDDYVARGHSYAVAGSRYFPGAVMCDMVFTAAGSAGIETLFKAGRRDEDLYRALQTTLGIDRSEFQLAWRRRVLDFNN